MRNVLLALTAVPLLACTATLASGPSRPQPVREVREPREPPPPPPPPPEHHHDRDHDHDRGPRAIEGTIRDAVTHRPIDRASVDVTGRGITGEMTVQTGPDGRFRTGEIPRGEFAIRVRREGYEPFNRNAEMNDGIAHLDFELIPKRR